jgi:hypothetical protein
MPLGGFQAVGEPAQGGAGGAEQGVAAGGGATGRWLRADGAIGERSAREF